MTSGGVATALIVKVHFHQFIRCDHGRQTAPLYRFYRSCGELSGSVCIVLIAPSILDRVGPTRSSAVGSLELTERSRSQPWRRAFPLGAAERCRLTVCFGPTKIDSAVNCCWLAAAPLVSFAHNVLAAVRALGGRPPPARCGHSKCCR